jgi:UDP-N-acetylglucosamine 4,6-dehydratase/5-epimerase
MKSPIGQRVFMTGGTGFLGRALLDRATREGWECEFTIYSRDEMKQWEIKNRWPSVRCILGEITDTARLTYAIIGHDTVLHLAAHKFVPEAERDVSVAIKANIDGTRAVADACLMARPDTAVFISTDKACNPVNLYGMTKAVGERVWGEAFRNSRHTRFRATRYGNVIGSTGSVLPLFVKLLRAGQPLQLTDPRMTRFLMSANDAVNCVIAAHAADSFMVIPRPSSADLPAIAQAAVLVATNGEDMTVMNVLNTGLRPGEKLHEELVSEREAQLVTDVDASFMYLLPEYLRPVRAPICGIINSEHADMTPWDIAELYRQTEAL